MNTGFSKQSSKNNDRPVVRQGQLHLIWYRLGC